MLPRFVFLIVIAMLGNAAIGDSTISGDICVMADEVSHKISRLTTGACIEDVNHEIYGGIYSQMIFGESFEELPDINKQFRDYNGYGGVWKIKGDYLQVGADGGSKLIYRHTDFSVGKVGMELSFSDIDYGNAGFITKVSDPGKGVNRFYGYEISLNPKDQTLILGRHRNNWEPIKEIPCQVPLDRWVKLQVEMQKESLRILVDGEEKLVYTDTSNPLEAGKIGFRSWHKNVNIRNFWIECKGEKITPGFVKHESVNYQGEVSGMWIPVVDGDVKANYQLVKNGTYNGKQSQYVEFVSGAGQVGISNRGLNQWGMCYRKGKEYEGYLWARAEKPVDIFLVLADKENKKNYAEKKITISSKEWNRYDFNIIPDTEDVDADFNIVMKEKGAVTYGHVFLQPGVWGRYKNLPCRKDVVDALVNQGITVLRYGGCMAEASEYNWKKMIGPRDKRPPYRGFWYTYSSNGWGIIDFIEMCQAAGFECIPDFMIDETVEDMVDFIEYVNGAANTEWGRLRVQHGHPEPYNLKYIQLGNEESLNEEYWAKFKPMAEAIWAKDANIKIIAGDFAYNERIIDPSNFRGVAVSNLDIHKKIVDLATKHGRSVWFDVHVNNNRPRNADIEEHGMFGMSDLFYHLKQLCPDGDFKVTIFEENAFNHLFYRGLAHAHTINEIQRFEYEMPVLCAANCLQPDKQNDNGWDQGMLFLNPSQVWGQSSYYVTKMFADNYLPVCVKSMSSSFNNALDVSACISEDGKQLSLRVVNLDFRAVDTDIRISGFSPMKQQVSIEQISGNLEDKNTPDNPEKIVPIKMTADLNFSGGIGEYVFPPYSFTIININANSNN